MDLADIAAGEGDYERAVELLTMCLSQLHQFGDKWSVAGALESLASVEVERRNSKRAAKLFGAAEVLRETVGMPLLESEYESYEKDVAAIRKDLNEEKFTQAWSAGRAMTMEQVIAFVIPGPETSAPVDKEKEKVGGLTPRELEAAVLIAQGKSNREIAEVMTISVKTVETYVTRILSKLDFDSRVQVATWVVENEIS